MKTKTLLCIIAFVPLVLGGQDLSGNQVPLWDRFELALESRTEYENPLYEVEEFSVRFIAPSGRTKKINGFWDGGRNWKVRFMPDECGTWTYQTHCSDSSNAGLHGIPGSFECVPHTSGLDLYQHGEVTALKGAYHLQHRDGTPFFWLACTAWNGGLKSSEQEWEHYLSQRAALGYNVIQLVGTQWRGCDRNQYGEVAFSGCGRIRIHPGFFQHLDRKMDRVNAHGHLAALVLLWALPFGQGMELSPGYYLPDREAILLARYMVARYGAHHVCWVLGGDGKYWEEQEDRWKHIGREVFKDKPQGISTTHPMGGHWTGELYAREDWCEIDGYQSSHSTSRHTVELVTRTLGEGWKNYRARPVINLEPCYEEIHQRIFAYEVRQASYRSVFACPPSGISYGADGIWPWIREGETALNHRPNPKVSTWDRAIELPGSKQIGLLGQLMRSLDWWDLYPAQDLLLEQPGDQDYHDFVSVLKSADHKQLLVYFPAELQVRLLLPPGTRYEYSWFNPRNGDMLPAEVDHKKRVLTVQNPLGKDAVLVAKTVD